MSKKLQTPIKIYRGKKRIAFRHYGGKFVRWLTWALALKPGDYFASCSGCNRRVARIEVRWMDHARWADELGRNRQSKTQFIYDVIIIDTRDYYHSYGGGCALPAESYEQQVEWWTSLPDDSPFKQAVLSGRKVVDEHGEFLTEFEKELIALR